MPSTSAVQLSSQPPRSAPTDNRNRNISNTVQSYISSKDSVTKAEIIWALTTVMSHYSLRSSEFCVEIFPLMFTDSEIAANIALKRTKLSYNIVYGIAPFFHKELLSIIKNCEHFVVAFDESLNKIVKRGQMDISIRFWDCSKTSANVVTRYFDSAFMGHATAEIILQKFLDCLKDLNLKKLLQISMDGPNVNLKFLRLFKQYSKGEQDDPQIVEIGTCGLHTVHNSFKCSFIEAEWKIQQFLTAIYTLFNDVPARRADYMKASNSTVFPLKFCKIRWVENKQVAERALNILSNIQKYVVFAQTNKCEPTCNSYKNVCEGLQDPLLQPKLAFFNFC